MKILAYGVCPQCGTACQPPDMPDENGYEFCFCCDCEIVWSIVHNEENKNAETWHEVYPVIDVLSFDDYGIVPYGC